MANTDRWRGFTRWFRRHAEAGLALAAGIAIGVGIRYPTGWVIPDNTAAMIAAVIGALATAAAVVIGVDLQSSRDEGKDEVRQGELRMRVKIMLQPYFVTLKKCQQDLGDATKRVWAARRLVEETAAVIDRLRASRVLSEGLDSGGLVALSYIEIAISTILPTARALVIITELCEQQRASTGGIYKLMNDLSQMSNELMDEVIVLAGGDPLDDWKLALP